MQLTLPRNEIPPHLTQYFRPKSGCGKCHVCVLVDVFRLVRKALRKDGVVFLNYGDMYACSPNGRTAADTKAIANDNRSFRDKPINTISGGLKPKDLVGMPWSVAFALRADGWWLRSDIIWAKRNPMAESVTDRPTRSHEYLFLMTKNNRYYYDADAIREPGTCPAGTRAAKGSEERRSQPGVNGRPPEYKIYSGTRNRRTVWNLVTQPFPEAHFATMPEALVKPCILAGTSEHGCCSACGAPYVRLRQPAEEYAKYLGRDWADYSKDEDEGRGHFERADGSRSAQRCVKRRAPSITAAYETVGWEPTCDCDASVQPCTVLDPFAGSGTVGLVATNLGRHAILIEMNPEYVKMCRKRTAQQSLML